MLPGNHTLFLLLAVAAAMTRVWSGELISFEVEEGFSKDKDPASAGGWRWSSPHCGKISDFTASSGCQSLEILCSRDGVLVHEFALPDDRIIFVDFSIRPIADTTNPPLGSLNINGAVIGFSEADAEGTIVAAGDCGAACSISAPDGFSFPIDDGQLSARWIRVTLREDLDSNTWDLFLDRRLAMADQPLDKTARGKKKAFLSLFCSALGNFFVDDLSISRTNPLFADFDRDGIPDAMELVTGTNAFRDDRNEDLNGDGICNILSFLRGSPIGNTGRWGRSVIYVDSRNGRDTFAGRFSYCISEEGPKATLGAAMQEAGPDTVIALLPGNQPYVFREKMKGSQNTINIMPVGDVTIETNSR